MKTLDFVGDSSACHIALEDFMRDKIDGTKPRINHLTMVAEHLVSAFAIETGQYAMMCSVDLDNGQLTFAIVKV